MHCIILQYVVDLQKLTYSALVLAMLFSTGEAVPLQYYGKSFSARPCHCSTMVSCSLLQSAGVEI